MGTWELVLICLGLSFDIYAVTACEGATLEKLQNISDTTLRLWPELLKI